jgi:DNA polymerase-4
VRKSLSAENTFEKDLISLRELEENLFPIYEELIRRIEKSGIKGRTITLKIKFSDFSQQTRSKTLDQYPESLGIWQTGQELLRQDEIPKAVRLLGLGLSNLNVVEEQEFLGAQLKIPFEGQQPSQNKS